MTTILSRGGRAVYPVETKRNNVWTTELINTLCVDPLWHSWAICALLGTFDWSTGNDFPDRNATISDLRRTKHTEINFKRMQKWLRDKMPLKGMFL